MKGDGERALVTGACGFMGSHAMDLLQAQGYTVRATDLPSANQDHVKRIGAEFVPSDLTKPETLKPALKDVEMVFNVASVFDYFAPYELLHKVNVVGMQNLCDTLLSSKVKRVIHWSTVGVYGPCKELPTTEESPKNPSNNYEKTKWEQEQLGMKFAKENGLPLTAIRPAPTYGPRNHYGMFNMFKLFSQGILTIIPSLYPQSQRIRIPMVHVTDVCRAALFLSDKKQTVGEVYNVVADAHPTADELMEFVFPLLNVKAHRLIVPAAVFPLFHKMFHGMAVKMETKARKMGKGVRPPLEVDTVNYMMNSYLFSNAKIRKLGFEFDYADFRKGVWETVGWYRQQGWLDV